MQLIANANVISSDDTVQLQNGCACCSMQDELLDSIGKLLTAHPWPIISLPPTYYMAVVESSIKVSTGER